MNFILAKSLEQKLQGLCIHLHIEVCLDMLHISGYVYFPPKFRKAKIVFKTSLKETKPNLSNISEIQ